MRIAQSCVSLSLYIYMYIHVLSLSLYLSLFLLFFTYMYAYVHTSMILRVWSLSSSLSVLLIGLVLVVRFFWRVLAWLLLLAPWKGLPALFSFVLLVILWLGPLGFVVVAVQLCYCLWIASGLPMPVTWERVCNTGWARAHEPYGTCWKLVILCMIGNTTGNLCISICIHMYIYIYICLQSIYTYIYIYIYVHDIVYMYICVYTYVCVQSCSLFFFSLYVYIYTHIYTYQLSLSLL